MRESELRAPVLAHLRSRGYAAWAAPDGRDYFDIVALRGGLVGLVELKVADGPKVFAQALRRRAWADWVAVAVPGLRTARRLATIREPAVAGRIGVWRVGPEGVVELRAAEPLRDPEDGDPFAESRARVRELLEGLGSGEIGPGIDWGIFGGPRPLGPGRRSTADYRLEEFSSR